MVSKKRIIAAYNRIYDNYSSEEERFEAISKELGVDTHQVIETVEQKELAA